MKIPEWPIRARGALNLGYVVEGVSLVASPFADVRPFSASGTFFPSQEVGSALSLSTHPRYAHQLTMHDASIKRHLRGVDRHFQDCT